MCILTWLIWLYILCICCKITRYIILYYFLVLSSPEALVKRDHIGTLPNGQPFINSWPAATRKPILLSDEISQTIAQASTWCSKAHYKDTPMSMLGITVAAAAVLTIQYILFNVCFLGPAGSGDCPGVHDAEEVRQGDSQDWQNIENSILFQWEPCRYIIFTVYIEDL